MAHEFQPFDDNVLGPDCNFGLELRKQGYKNYTDWGIPCLHHTDDDIINPNNVDIRQVEYFKSRKTWKKRTM